MFRTFLRIRFSYSHFWMSIIYKKFSSISQDSDFRLHLWPATLKMSYNTVGKLFRQWVRDFSEKRDRNCKHGDNGRRDVLEILRMCLPRKRRNAAFGKSVATFTCVTFVKCYFTSYLSCHVSLSASDLRRIVLVWAPCTIIK